MREYIDIYKEISATNTRHPFRDAICAIRLREIVEIMAHDAVHILLKLEPSDEDRTLLRRPCVAPRSHDEIDARELVTCV